MSLLVTDLPFPMREVHREFRDIAGVSLTLIQAEKLFRLSHDGCEQMLLSMVEKGMLELTRDGRYTYRAVAAS
jgi:hypothetical protein